MIKKVNNLILSNKKENYKEVDSIRYSLNKFLELFYLRAE